MNSGIYIIKNIIDGKVYVGSAKDFNKRKLRHFNDLKKNKHSSIKLQRAYNKYGESNFIFEEIERFEYSIEIKDREQYWIEKLNSKVNGYNIADATFGDMLSNHPNREQIIQKISNSIKEFVNNLTKDERKKKWGKFEDQNGMWDPDNHIFCIICGKRVWGSKTYLPDKQYCIEHFPKDCENNPFYGKHHTEETKQKLSELKKDYYKNNPEVISKIREQVKEKWQDEEFTEQVSKSMSDAHIGFKHSEETKNKIGAKHKGKIISEETREKLRIINIGKIFSEEAKIKNSETWKNKKSKWYTNGIIAIRISEGEEIPEGFLLGRKLKKE
jgi:group I intron endonuclease